MPMHDWKRVPPTIYHHFHQQWTIAICNALNAGVLPPGYSALVEQFSSGLDPDVPAVQRRDRTPSGPGVEMTTLDAPRTRMTVHPREGRFHERANRVVIRSSEHTRLRGTYAHRTSGTSSSTAPCRKRTWRRDEKDDLQAAAQAMRRMLVDHDPSRLGVASGSTRRPIRACS